VSTEPSRTQGPAVGAARIYRFIGAVEAQRTRGGLRCREVNYRGANSKGSPMAWDRASITVRFRGISQRASENLWAAYANRRWSRHNRSDGNKGPSASSSAARYVYPRPAACAWGSGKARG